MMRLPAASTLLLIATGAVFGCSKGDTSASATASDSVTTATSSAPSSATGPSKPTPVRGTLTSITDSILTVSSATGEVRIAIAAPLAVYSRVPAKLSQVKESSFVGVTSVAQPDGSQRATEIHIFPDKLRGTGEGSYLMTQPSGSAGGSRNTMTNGTVTSSRMTNGTAAAPRMTNGTISGQPGGTLAGTVPGRHPDDHHSFKRIRHHHRAHAEQADTRLERRGADDQAAGWHVHGVGGNVGRCTGAGEVDGDFLQPR